MADVATALKPRFTSNVTVAHDRMSIDSLRMLAENDPKQFMGRVNTLVEKGEFSWSHVRDVKGLFQALWDVEVPVMVDFIGSQRAIMASAFPVLSGALTAAGITAGYDSVPTVGQELVTEVEDPKTVSTFVGITSEDPAVDSVEEGAPFPEIHAGEEKFEIRNKRNGRRLSITAEMIEKNDVSGIVGRVNALGAIAAEHVEEQTLSRVTDQFGSKTTSDSEPYVLRIDGASGQALYATSNATPLTRLGASGNRKTNNALANEDDLDNARALLGAMTNSRGKRINIPMSSTILFVPNALESTALKILGSELTPGVANEVSPWGPRGAWRPRLLSTSLLDDLKTDVWYLGDFKRQFTRKWSFRFEFVTLGNDTQAMLTNRIVFQARVAWDMEVGATDYVFVIQNLPSTTYT